MASRDRARIVRIGWNSARYALGPVGGIVVPWVVIHHGSRSVWGEVVALMVVVQLAAHILGWGSKDNLLRLFARSPVHVRYFWGDSVLTRSVLVPVMALVLFRYATVPVLALGWMAALFLTAAFDALVIQRERFAAAFLIDASALLVQVLGLHFLETPTVPRIVGWMLIGQLCRLVPLLILFRRELPVRARFDARTHLITALPFFLIGLSGLLGSRVDLYTMTALVDKERLGAYQVITALFLQFQALSGLISAPFTRELYRMPGASVRLAALRLGRLGLLLVPVFLLMAWLVLEGLFRFEVSALTYVAGALIVWPAFAYVPLITGLYKHGKERSLLLANLCAAAAEFLLTLTLVPLLGIDGALLGAAIGQWSVLVIILLVTRRTEHALPTV